MFTGIVEEIGTIRSIHRGTHSAVLCIDARDVLTDLRPGDSVAVNGVCLTATAKSANSFTADVMHETLRRSTLGALTPGSRVNLERALSASGRFGGHIVSGHIDGTGTVVSLRQDGIAVWFTMRAAPELLRFIVEKGSVAIDGVSLTVAEVTADTFSVSVIPHTADATVLFEKMTGSEVNLETDILGKYVEKLLRSAPQVAHKSDISQEFLLKNGF